MNNYIKNDENEENHKNHKNKKYLIIFNIYCDNNCENFYNHNTK